MMPCCQKLYTNKTYTFEMKQGEKNKNQAIKETSETF